MHAPSTQSADRLSGPTRSLSLSIKIADYSVLTLAVILGVGSIVLFAWPGRPVFVPLRLSRGAAVWWNTLVSFVFFFQHSVMVRRSVRARLAAVIPQRYDSAFYAITSGIALTVVAVLLQPGGEPLFVLDGVPRLAANTAALLAVAGFAWGVYALRTFDLLGLRPIREHLRGDRRRSSATKSEGGLVVRGPYRWVRHPLYSCIIVLLWADPAMNLGRFMLAALWSTWIYIGALLEERDLIFDFGDTYREYRRRVPILIPWRGPIALQRTAKPSAVGREV